MAGELDIHPRDIEHRDRHIDGVDADALVGPIAQLDRNPKIGSHHRILGIPGEVDAGQLEDEVARLVCRSGAGDAERPAEAVLVEPLEQGLQLIGREIG